ncbi:MAG: hypothetical protein VKJ64_08440 [Leptolyngbyaceae bacterium]|nr:hypothetical protein [Leptolyngbyaceae bacterium]
MALKCIQNYILHQKARRPGHFETANQAIEVALQLLEKWIHYDGWVEDTQQKIDIAAAQLDRAEGVDGEDTLVDLCEASIAQSQCPSEPSPILVWASEQRFATFGDVEIPNVSRETIRSDVDFLGEWE